MIPNMLSCSSQRFNLSSALRENQGTLITSLNLESLIPKKRPAVSSQADRLLRAIAHVFPSPGKYFQINFDNVEDMLASVNNPDIDEWISEADPAIEFGRSYMPLMAAAWAHSEREFNFLLAGVLTVSRGFLGSKSGLNYVITAGGWEFLERAKPNAASAEAFVAMSFDRSLDLIYRDLIAPAIADCGYEPIRVDQTEHVNRIDDEIIARIRGSRFIVADFTNHKNGVYFEAGFALGIGIPVIWMCSQQDLEKSHFDTRQFNTVVWSPDAVPDARRRLSIRIAAVVGTK